MERYSTAGVLQSITDIQGNTQTLTHDDQGRLSRVETNAGEYLIFGYDASDRITSVTDQSNRSWGYRYDIASNLEYIDNPDGTIKQYHYEHYNYPHALTGITDERGTRYARYGYDHEGRVIDSTHGDGIAQDITIYYQEDGTRIVTNSHGTQSIYSTAVQLGVALVTDISGPGCSTCGPGNTSHNYDPANNNLLSKTENGITTQYGDYDDKGQYGYRIEAVGTPEERRTDYSYDPRFFNKITSIEEPSVAPGQSKLTTYTYDDWGNRLSETINGFAPDGTPVFRSTTWEYEGPLHQLSRIDGPRTDVADITTYDYYPDDPAQGPNRARLLRVTDALGVAVRDQIQYTPTGKVMSESRPNGLTLAYDYYYGNDRLEMLTESDGTSSRVTRWTYLATGEVESITQAHGSFDTTTLTFGYDDARRLTRITDGLGNYIEYQLDTEGNQEAERIHDASGVLRKQLTQTFDLYNRLDTRTQANEHIDQDMAPNGALARSTDGRGSVTDYSYDALKRLTQVVQDQAGIDPGTANATIQYGYDASGRLASVTDPIDGNTLYVYDDLGNLLSQVSPDTGITTFTHDEAGNILTKIDAMGQMFHYSHDALNRLTLADAPGMGDDIFYDYDTCPGGVGRLCRVSNADAIVQYQYDRFGNPTGLPGVQYAYDKAGRVRTLTYPSGARVTYHHDDAGQIGSVDLTIDGVTQSLASNITYTAFGPVTSLGYGNGQNLTQTFDTAYRMLSQDIPGVLALAYPQYDANGNLTNRTRDGQNEGYGYDALDRMDNATGPFGTRDYAYDPNGNRTGLDGTAYVYTPNSNRLTAIGSADVLLDDNGNTLNQGAWTFDYTTHNRLETAHQDGSLAATYAYNGLGQRFRKQLPDGKGRHFLYGINGELLAETDIDGNILNEYIYLNGQLLALYQPDDSGNGLTNAEEDAFGTNPANTDRDGDGLTDLDEWFQIGTDARNADTDGDGVLDGEEYATGTDPASAASYPGDGDVNQDGEVNVGDLLLVTQMALGQRTPTPEQLVRADINRDDVIDVVDVLLLQRRILGLSFLELFHELPGSQKLLAAIDHTRLAFNSRVEELQDSFIGTAQAATPNGKVYFVHNDHLKTPKVLTDEAGNVVWSASHDPFGMAAVDEDPDGDGVKVVLNVRFPGQYFDVETGLHYNYFRTYDPGTGRYLESDPIGLRGGLNTYAYAEGNPLLFTDPMGLASRIDGWEYAIYPPEFNSQPPYCEGEWDQIDNLFLPVLQLFTCKCRWVCNNCDGLSRGGTYDTYGTPGGHGSYSAGWEDKGHKARIKYKVEPKFCYCSPPGESTGCEQCQK
ncbi:MAG: RHS domain-containing protein [Gammaproteobacteria bacterium]|nr:RHS domain-containing protein [Gammaproteobacteria bacterium]